MSCPTGSVLPVESAAEPPGKRLVQPATRKAWTETAAAKGAALTSAGSLRKARTADEWIAAMEDRMDEAELQRYWALAYGSDPPSVETMLAKIAEDLLQEQAENEDAER